eukprot:4469039-Ditylum_brightwellii.AAC.1
MEKTIGKIFSEYAEALLAADLEPVDFLTLDKIWEKETLSRIRTKKKCCDNLKTFFVIDYSSFLKKAKIPDLIHKLKK